MDPQYIYDDSTSPPTQSVLQYSIDPDTVYVSTDEKTMYADLTITVCNPQDEAVTCQAFQFGFYVGAGEGDLTPDASSIQASSSLASWPISQQAQESPDDPTLYTFSAASSAPYSLSSKDMLVFSLAGIEINSMAPDSVPIFITEVTGPDPKNPVIVQGQLEISQVSGSLAITSFEPTGKPGLFSPGSQVTLNWELVGADKWQLFGSDSDQPLYDSWGSPVNETSYTDTPQQDTTYTLVAWDNTLFTTQTVDVSVMAASFVGEAIVSPSEVAYDATATLTWKTRFATQLQITAPGFPTLVLNAAPGLYDYFPQAPDNEASLPPNTYTLTAFGPGGSQDQQQVTISIQLPAPAVNAFMADPQMINTGESVNLAWETSYATIAVLMENSVGATSPPTPPQIVALNSSEYPSSVYTVTPAGSTTYTLLVKGQGQSSAQVLVLEIEGKFPCPAPSALAFDGTYLWAASATETDVGSVIILDQNCVQVGQPLSAPVSSLPQILAFDGTYVWLADFISASVYALQATSNGPVWASPSLQYQTQLVTPKAITYDDVNGCLWVACSQPQLGQDVLFKLILNNGTIQSEQFQIPIYGSSAIASDGEYVWIAGLDSVTVIQTSDGDAVHTVMVGSDSGPYAVPSGLVYDGKHIWVRNYGDAQLVILDPASGEQVGDPIPIGTGPGGSMLAYDGTYIWTGGSGGLTIIRASDGATAFNSAWGQTPVAFCFDGSNMWVADTKGNMVTKFSA
jgi:DNA-binding beta-propeller fold protein YncE